jgi:hypothetical protein
MTSYENGATRSEQKPRYDLIPLVALKRLAERLTMGAGVHGEDNYKRGGDAFWRDTVNHGLEHYLKWVDGDRSEDHLAAVMCNIAMMMWKEAVDKPTLQNPTKE